MSADEPGGTATIHVSKVAADAVVRLRVLPYRVYLCGLWVGCSKLAAYYDDLLPGDIRALHSATLDVLRRAVDGSSANLGDLPAFVTRWTEYEDQIRGTFHAGMVKAVKTLREALEELTGELPPRRAADTFIYMFWYMEPGTPEYRVSRPKLRILTGVHVDPESFLGARMVELTRLCDLLEAAARTSESFDPEAIAEAL